MTDEHRPSPEAILAALHTVGRGRLRVFLGAAPGVGKTYAMLSEAAEQRAHGVDVVGGIVETHGRAETGALLEGLELLPRQSLEYRGTQLAEMDLDALLRRRPQLALVDELAHSNVPGSRHEKRYLDVAELLDAGIDVWTTMNVQHVESLNDAVAQITGVRVRETVPDTVLAGADEVEVIDLAPADLLRRLEEGKVYVPETAAAAVRKFFRPGNLSALRELALRQAAERAGDQTRSYMAAHAIEGPWPTAELIVVCVSPSPLSPRLVRTARRMAQRRNCRFIAVYVKGARHYALPDRDRDRVAATLRLAEQLDGEAVTIPGDDVAHDLLRYAASRNATEIIVGKSLRSRWQELLHGSVVGDLIRDSGHIDVYVVTGEPGAAGADRSLAAEGQFGSWSGYAASVVAVLLAALAGRLLQAYLTLPNLSMVFLLSVLYSALNCGLGPAVCAAVLSMLAYDFLFVQPLYRFTVQDPQDVLALTMYLAVAILTSRLTSRVSAQADAARAREEQTSALFALSRRMTAAGSLADVLQAVVQETSDSLHARIAVLLPVGETLAQRAAAPPEVRLTDSELAAATWAFQHERPTGQGSDTLPGVAWYCLPLCTARGRFGVLACQLATVGRPLSPSQRRLLEALSDLSAVAIERVGLAEETEAARLAASSEALRSNLLASVSHDLRTPLAVIAGASSTLLQTHQPPADERRGLLETINDEAERLARLIGNLLRLTQLEAGVALACDWHPLQDICGSALRASRRALVGRSVSVDVRPELLLGWLDAVLVEQLLINLLDNASRYTPAGSGLELAAWRSGDELRIELTDHGPGLAPGDSERIFETFQRGANAKADSRGAGLGLAICRAVAQAHGGTLTARNSDTGGAVFSLGLPQTQPPPSVAFLGEDDDDDE